MLLILLWELSFVERQLGSQEFIFEEEGFFEISENKFPLKFTRYMVYEWYNDCDLTFEPA